MNLNQAQLEECRKRVDVALAILLIVLAVICADGATNAPMAKTVYLVATNVPGKATGSLKYPLDASTPKKFDALFRSFPVSTRIKIIEGEYETTGSAAYNPQGFYVKDGWKIAGIGKVVIQHVATFPESGGNALGVFEHDYQGLGGITIENLTVDENGKALIGKSGSTFAVRLSGNNNTIRKVTAIHGCGNRATWDESFTFTICSRYDRPTLRWQDNTNGLIEFCVVQDYFGNYGVAIGLLFGADGFSGSVRGNVRSNTVLNFFGTAPYGFCNNATYTGNLASNCFGGFYTDTGECHDVVAGYNTLLNGAGFAFHFSPSLGAASVRNVLIEGNFIETHGIGVALSSPLGPGHLVNVTIRRNTFTGSGDAIVAAYVNGLAVEDNLVNEHLESTIQWAEYPSQNVRSRRNYRLPAPTGLENKP